MAIQFSKYQGTGNDFILIDNRDGQFDQSNIGLIQKLCDRHFGIGSDGLTLIENHEEQDFEMVFFNPDGSQSFCGNGSRCAVVFANSLEIIGREATFFSTDGIHQAKIMENEEVNLSMKDVGSVEEIGADFFIHTGSPHYVSFMDGILKIPFIEKAHAIRYNDRFSKEGVNVNFVNWKNEVLHMRTYERGVEGETLSCGTGVTASALCLAYRDKLNGPIAVKTQGGNLLVSYEKTADGFTDIWLKGAASFVYSGTIEL